MVACLCNPKDWKTEARTLPWVQGQSKLHSLRQARSKSETPSQSVSSVVCIPFSLPSWHLLEMCSVPRAALTVGEIPSLIIQLCDVGSLPVPVLQKPHSLESRKWNWNVSLNLQPSPCTIVSTEINLSFGFLLFAEQRRIMSYPMCIFRSAGDWTCGLTNVRQVSTTKLYPQSKNSVFTISTKGRTQKINRDRAAQGEPGRRAVAMFEHLPLWFLLG